MNDLTSIACLSLTALLTDQILRRPNRRKWTGIVLMSCAIASFFLEHGTLLGIPGFLWPIFLAATGIHLLTHQTKHCSDADQREGS
ncbi:MULTISPECIES: hypothetical protein [Pseudomonas]|uniref:DUF5668 domain-containing protein n=1 Tax=Pseudomonas machongensis TaxID=3110229 RepID=A0ABU5VJF0_9PSED|nr:MULTISPECIES: hypothetical protein [Pseudomonas]MEA5673392.1 hypothetical protein [Pseudomonas sp. MH2]